MNITEFYQGLHNLPSNPLKKKKIKRVGRGHGSGYGKTSGRGHKGQKSRKSGHVRVGFEGGQNPFSRRQPKRGFKNIRFKTLYTTINVGLLEKYFRQDDIIYKESLLKAGLIQKGKKIKLLGAGNVKNKFKVIVDSASEVAIDKIKLVGGTVLLGDK